MLRATVAALLLAGSVSAQNIVTPADRGPTDTGCQIKGLDAAGFVVIRSGPGTEYPELGRLRNDDAAYVYSSAKGPWIYIENGSQNRVEAQFRGWIYDAYCSFYP